ncbi:MAG: hypothetical protein OXB98_06010 [Bryobacterales bacterium]|nr:hypothetical protein [Bryobacterales bacterium]
MNLPSRDEQRIDELQQRRQKLEKEVKKRRAKLQADLRRASKRISERERKLETRRKILTGKAFLIAIEHDPQLRDWYYSEFPKHLTNDRDRALFDLPPLDPDKPTSSSDATAKSTRRFPWPRNLLKINSHINRLFRKPSR